MNQQFQYYERYSHEVTRALGGLVTTAESGEQIRGEVAFKRWCSMTRDVFGNNRTVYFVGNGASAAMASHMAADSSKNGELRAMAFNDSSLMTAVSNDISFEDCFAEPVKRFGLAVDLLITISSSGNSENIIRAIQAARPLGMGVVTLSGMREDNRSRLLGDVNFFVPAKTYGIVECCHQVLLHCWLDQFMGVSEWGQAADSGPTE